MFKYSLCGWCHLVCQSYRNSVVCGMKWCVCVLISGTATSSKHTTYRKTSLLRAVFFSIITHRLHTYPGTQVPTYSCGTGVLLQSNPSSFVDVVVFADVVGSSGGRGHAVGGSGGGWYCL